MKLYIAYLALTIATLLGAYAQPTTPEIDKLKEKLAKETVDTIRVKMLNTIARKYQTIQTDESVKYARKALELGQKTGYIEGQLDAWNKLGLAYDNQGSFAEALKHFQKGLKLAREKKVKRQQAFMLHNMSATYRHMGNAKKAISADFESLKLFNAIGQKGGELSVTLSIGNIYYTIQKDYNKALGQYEKALVLAKKLKHEKGIALCLMNISGMHSELGRHEKSQEFARAALKIAEARNDQYQVAMIMNNMASTYRQQKMYDKGIECAQKCIDITTAANNQNALSSGFYTLAGIYIEKKMYDKALTYALKSLEIARTIRAKTTVINVVEMISEIYQHQKKYKEALEYHLLHRKHSDSLLNVKNNQHLENLRVNYEVEKKEQLMRSLAKDNHIKTLENGRRKNSQVVLIISLVFVMLFLLLIINRYQNKKQANKMLAQKNETISQTLHEKEILLKEVHHRVKNNLQIVSSLLNLQGEFNSNENPEELLRKSQSKIQTMAIIHEKLYKSDNLASIDLKTYLESLLGYFETSYELSAHDISIQTDIGEVALDMDHLVPCGLIVNELITNSIKYAFPDKQQGVISVNTSSQDNQCTLTIEDNGVGLPQNFSLSQVHSLGLRLVQGLTSQIKGSLAISNHSGTRVQITFAV